MWAHWGITHFHLPENFPKRKGDYSERSKWQLFAIVTPDYFLAIDIRDHDDKNLYEDIKHIEIVKRNWPKYFESFKMHGIHGVDQLSSDEIKKGRLSGLTLPISFDGDCYMPMGMGVVCAAISTKVILQSHRCVYCAHQLAEELLDQNSELYAQITNNLSSPENLRLKLVGKGIAIFSEELDVNFFLPYRAEAPYHNYLEELHSMLFLIS